MSNNITVTDVISASDQVSKKSIFFVFDSEPWLLTAEFSLGHVCRSGISGLHTYSHSCDRCDASLIASFKTWNTL